jgi:hypothetical protein
MRKISYLVIFSVFLLSCEMLSAQINVTFEEDVIGQIPSIAPGNGSKPSGLFGDYENTMTIQNLSGTVGSSTANGKVVEINVPSTGNFNLLEFDALLNSGMIATGVIKVSFDLMVFSDANTDGFAFLRNIDESDESIADLGFNFNGNTYNIGILDYDPDTGNYLGWNDPGFPNNTFNAGVWYQIESTVNLDTNVHSLKINGLDYGVTGGVSRATGTSYIGSFVNFGTAFQGKAAIDNVKVEVVSSNSLPNAPNTLLDLLTVNPPEGNVIRIPNGDFRQPGIDWESNATATLFLKPYYQNLNTYTVTVNSDLDEADARLSSFNSFPFIPNRTYEVTALVRTNFPRATWELNIGYHGSETATPTPEEISEGARYSGLPNITSGPDGWERWTWKFTPHWDERYSYVNVFLGLHEFGPEFDGNVTFDIADIAFIELPEIPLNAPASGSGVSIAGGNGDLNMAIENVDAMNNPIKVTVTGAEFEFDTAQGTLTAHQRIDYERVLTVIDQLPLEELTVQSETAEEVILVGTNVTIGVQMDGVVMISPHTTIDPRITNKIGGDFNRLEAGDLLSQDDFGGFTVNKYSPKGSGIIPAITPITANLPLSTFREMIL